MCWYHVLYDVKEKVVSRFASTVSAVAIQGNGGGERDRTDDLLLAKQALSQLSYTPHRTLAREVVGLGRFELPTSRLSGVRSNQLSYRPESVATPG